MTIRQPFYPKYGSNQVLTSAAATASVDIDPVPKQLRVVNTGTGLAYFRTYSSQTVPQVASAANATIADMPIAAGATVTVSTGVLDDKFAHISALGTTLQIISGEGF